MTGLLTDLLHDQAESLSAATFDSERIIRDGNRRVARRRVGVVAAGAAAAVVAGFAIPAVLPGDTGGPDKSVIRVSDSPFAGAFADHQPTYAVGSVIHIGGLAFDVGTKIRAFVPTDVGVVFSDAAGTVWAADGVDVVEVGETQKKYPQLKAGGTYAAWVEPNGDAAPVFAVLDQTSGEVVRDTLGSAPGMGLLSDTEDPALIYAIDGDEVYVRSAPGVSRWHPESGFQEYLQSDSGEDGAFEITDVKNGVIAYRPGTSPGESDGGPSFRVGPDLFTGKELNLWNGYTLSPDGRYLLGERESDVVQVFDVTTGETVLGSDPGYDYFAGYAWIDNDTYAALGMTQPWDTTPVDVLTCEVGGVCVVIEEAAGSMASDGFVMPNGQAMN